jgi:RNase P/RNase MRP subunit p30
LLRDPQRRKTEIQLAYRIGELSDYKGIIVSSGCLSESEIRSPGDAASIFHLVNYPENILPHLTKKNPTCAIVNAYKRKTAKCALILKRKTASEVDLESAKRVRE